MDERLFESVELLFSRLEGFDYVLVGGLALLSYIEGRNTQDIDLIMSRGDLEELPELLVSDSDSDFARADYSGLRVDLLLTSNLLFNRVRREFACKREFGGRSVKVATPTGLVLLKLYALPSLYRQGQFGRADIYESDLFQLLSQYAVDLTSVFEVLSPHLIQSDIQELQSVVREILNRIEKPRFQ